MSLFPPTRATNVTPNSRTSNLSDARDVWLLVTAAWNVKQPPGNMDMLPLRPDKRRLQRPARTSLFVTTRSRRICESCGKLSGSWVDGLEGLAGSGEAIGNSCSLSSLVTHYLNFVYSITEQ